MPFVAKLKALAALILMTLGIGVPQTFKDDSSAIFLPKQMRQLAEAGQHFSFFWKGILLIEAKDRENALSFADQVCKFLKQDESISDYYCTKNNFRQNPEQLKAWIADTSLRKKIPTAQEFQKTLQQQMAFMSLPGIPRELMASMRGDPFGASQDLWSLKQKTFTFSSELGGYFSNKAQNMIMIPLAFKNSPQDVAETKIFMNKIESLCQGEACPHHALVGPHASTYINQSRVMSDLSLVTALGAFFLLGLILLLGWKRGAALVSLAIPLIPALLIALAITFFIFGSVHGLTLAFGPGLVGLSLDYGLQAKIHRGSKAAWLSNLYGVLTTLSGFVVLLFSEIPLVRQLMVFALSGLIVSFIIYYFLSRRQSWLWRSTHFEVLPFQLPRKAWSGPCMCFLLLASLVLWKVVPIDLNLKNFEFRQKYQSELEKNWWTAQEAPEILFSVEAMENKKFPYQEKEWASQNSVTLQNLAVYLPSEKEQGENLRTWSEPKCQNLFHFDKVSDKFFEPFKQSNFCQNQTKAPTNPPSYVSDFVSKDPAHPQLLSVWFPKGADQKTALGAKYPQATSLRKIFEEFPKILLREVWLMFPIGFLLCFLLIYYHLRKFFYSFLAIVPMFTAIGLVLLFFALFGKALSFVGCIALLMIFGSSVDYGIFQVDSLLRPPGRAVLAETFSAIFMASLTTLLGYLPLIFAKHPILNDLGWVLSLGTIGAFLGSVWGIPYLVEKFPRLKRST